MKKKELEKELENAKRLLDIITKQRDEARKNVQEVRKVWIDLREEYTEHFRIANQKIDELRAQRDELHERIHGKRDRDLSYDREWLAMVSSLVEQKGLK